MAYDLNAEDRHRIEVQRETPFSYKRTFRPVVVRERHDGWSCEKQAHFIELFGECGCVTEACAAVGMSTASAYRLKARFDAVDFRLAWDAALDFACGRIEDGMFSRAINGAVVPHYYQGELVGEHRRHDERLTQFILRYRKPLTYARHWDRQAVVRGHSEDDAERFAVGVDRVLHDDSRTMLEEESADAAAAHAERDNANADSAIVAAERAAAKATAAAARAEQTGDAIDANIARETADWAASLDREADAAVARAIDTLDWAATAAARAEFGKRNQAGGDVAQPSQPSARGDQPDGFTGKGPRGPSTRQRRAARRAQQRREGART